MRLKNYFKAAQNKKWAIGQFNFSSLEQLKAILLACQKMKSPAILGTSEGESAYFGLEEAAALVQIWNKKHNVSAFLNLDHGKDQNIIKKAIDSGYDAVHFDGSLLPFKENVRITKILADYAHKKGILLEGELGHIGGESSLHKKQALVKESELALVSQVSDFVKHTGVDSLAVAIGTTHGIYKNEPEIDFKRLKDIKSKTKAFLVLHGGSGVPENQIKKAISMGIVKININTELRVIWRNSLESALKNPNEVKPYKIFPGTISDIQKKVEEKMKLFGSRNRLA